MCASFWNPINNHFGIQYFRVSISLTLFICLFGHFKIKAQEKTIHHTLIIENGVTVSGEQAISGTSNRVSPNLFGLSYQRTVLRSGQRRFLGNSLRIRSEILSGFYVPLIFAYFIEEKQAYDTWEIYAPGFSILGEAKYMLKLNDKLELGILAGDISFPHSIIYLGPSKMYTGICATVPDKVLNIPFSSEWELYFTLKRPWSDPPFHASPYNVAGLNYKVILSLTKKGNLKAFTGIRYLKLLPPGSRLVNGGGQAYRIDLGLQFCLSKQRSSM